MCAMSPRLLRPVASGFDPRRIAGLEAWYDAADQSTMTIVSGALSEWRSKAGAARALTQGTSASRPTLTSAYYNGRSAVSFDGSNDALFATGLTALSTSPLTLAIALDSEIASGTSDRGTMALANTAQSNSFNNDGGFNLVANSQGRSARKAFEFYDRAASGGYDVETVQANSDQPVGKKVYLLTANGTTATFFENGSQIDSQSGTVSTSTSAIYLGALRNSSAAGLFWLGKILEVCIYTRAISTAERSRLERYLGNRWGVTVA